MENWEITFINELAKNNIELTDKQLKQFQLYADTLIEWNKKMNLTAIDDYEGIYMKHFYDCLVSSFNFDYHGSLCDVGAGAGFPSIVLKIVFPELKVTIIEPLQKRCRFLTHLIEVLELRDVEIINGRAEDVAKQKRESFDLVTARAVANLVMLSELCIPLVKKDGYFIALKGNNGHNENDEAIFAINKLGCKLEKEEVVNYQDNTRVNLFYKKVKSTPKQFPRMFAKIKKEPLRG